MKHLVCLVTIAMFLCIGAAYSAVTYMGTDTATQGDWIGKYGNDGAILFAVDDMSELAKITLFDDAGNNRWDWANPTDDTRGLLYPDGSGSRTGSCMYNNPTSAISVETSLDSYQVAVHMMDWDSEVRVQDVVGFQGDTAPETPDATVEGPDFHNGVYHLWQVTGSDPFKLQIVHQGGANWVLSGFFVDAIGGTAVAPEGKLASRWAALKEAK